MKCPRCGNEDPRAFYNLKGRIYCRRCIQFHRIYLDEDLSVKPVLMTQGSPAYTLSFNLTPMQERISKALIHNYHIGRPTLVLAVCGAGKTEMTFGLIAEAISHGHRVCFCVPRKALCLELYERLTVHFTELSIGLIYGGCQQNIDAPLIICTTHQLYRFVRTPFDVMLMDEADAYPFYGDEVLASIFQACTKSFYVKMSATLTNKDLHGEDVLIMNRRYHGHDLPVPQIVLLPRLLWVKFVKQKICHWIKANAPVLIYVPLKENIGFYVDQLTEFRIKGVSSRSRQINQAVADLKKGRIDCLVTTTILERGITVEDVQVIVLHASHPIFDERTLIQIAGRVGRKIDHPSGQVLLVDGCFSREMKQCIKTIRKLNHMSASSV